MAISLIFNKYTLGSVAVGWFAYPWIMAHVAILENVAETLSRIAG